MDWHVSNASLLPFGEGIHASMPTEGSRVFIRPRRQNNGGTGGLGLKRPFLGGGGTKKSVSTEVRATPLQAASLKEREVESVHKRSLGLVDEPPLHNADNNDNANNDNAAFEEQRTRRSFQNNLLKKKGAVAQDLELI